MLKRQNVRYQIQDQDLGQEVNNPKGRKKLGHGTEISHIPGSFIHFSTAKVKP